MPEPGSPELNLSIPQKDVTFDQVETDQPITKEQPKVREKITLEKKEILRTQSGHVLMEINAKCYTGCDWCYKLNDISAKGEQLSLDIIKQRIDWLLAFTNTKEITFLGGEPLLHPDLSAIIDYAIEKGLTPNIITSMRVSKIEHERANRKMVLERYKNGDIDLDVSLQYGRNNKEYSKTIKKIREISSIRKKRAKMSKKVYQRDGEKVPDRINEVLNNKDLFSTITLDDRFKDKSKFEEMLRFILSDCLDAVPEKCTFFDEKINYSRFVDEQHRRLLKHFLPYSKSRVYHLNLEIERGASFEFRLWGADKIIPVLWNKGEVDARVYRQVVTPRGHKDYDVVCPALGTTYDTNNKQININTPLVRADGEVTFASPKCIAAKTGICNTDIHQTVASIVDAVTGTIDDIKIVTFIGKRNEFGMTGDKAKSFCKLDPQNPKALDSHDKICPGCPVNISCNFCAVSRRIDKQQETGLNTIPLSSI